MNWNKMYERFLDGISDKISGQELELAWHSYQAEVRKQEWFSAENDINTLCTEPKFATQQTQATCPKKVKRIKSPITTPTKITATHSLAEVKRNIKFVAIGVGLAAASIISYDFMPIQYNNVAENGKVIYWRTLSGREGLKLISVPESGTQVLLMKNGKLVNYTIYPDSSPNKPKDKQGIGVGMNGVIFIPFNNQNQR